MPSMIITNPPASGGQPIFSSGNIQSGMTFPITSGRNPWPIGGIQLRSDPLNLSGVIIFIGLSGSMTINSGGMPLSGGILSGALDGMPLAPGDTYWIPNSAIPKSGFFNVFALPNAAGSGIARLYAEVF